MRPTPIKRNQNLVPLSKDHHEGLLVVWKIRQGCRLEIAEKRIANFILYAFDNHLEPHFTEEEEWVFIKLPDDDELLIKAIEQHTDLRKMVAELRSDTEPTTAQFEGFGNLLEEHIRFEERELFGHLEAEVTDDVMASIGARLEVIHQNHHSLYWKDEFWFRK
jgi:hemerythrin-like domain-containing protein